jgi:hypothetical protein
MINAAMRVNRPDCQQCAADDFDQPGKPDQRNQIEIVEIGYMRKAKALGQTMLEEQESGDDAQHAEHPLGPLMIEDLHLPPLPRFRSNYRHHSTGGTGTD